MTLFDNNTLDRLSDSLFIKHASESMINFIKGKYILASDMLNAVDEFNKFGPKNRWIFDESEESRREFIDNNLKEGNTKFLVLLTQYALDGHSDSKVYQFVIMDFHNNPRIQPYWANIEGFQTLLNSYQRIKCEKNCWRLICEHYNMGIYGIYQLNNQFDNEEFFKFLGDGNRFF
jgi:hypothetical protein